ncbi:MAG TPA: LD-carboxypeptidase [Longimicrobiaceae bacterium]|nr:LD-carboxypeptidase [Longimicrobiaceae bacterium]
MIRPPVLGPGARIALVAPAGPVPAEAVDLALERVHAWGWEPLLGRHARGRHGYLSGTDAERLADLNGALRSPENEAIWCLRGGYGTMRLLERIDWDALVRRPRPLIGFSDNTALHLAIHRRGLVSFHGPHAAAELPPTAEEVLLAVLTRPEPAGALPFPAGWPGAETLVGGRAEGPLVGGNLSLIAATLGTPYQIRSEGAILFLEEVGEPAYRLDRLLSQLQLAGVLRGVAGIALGGFTECGGVSRAGIPSALEVLRDRLSELRVPIAAGLPFGHIPESWTLPLGIRARLDASAGVLELLEPAVAPGRKS